MDVKVLSSEATIMDGKVVINEQTQKILVSSAINNFIITEQQRQINI